MKTYALIALILAAAGAGAGWLHERDARIAAEAVREVLVVRADSLATVADSAVQVAERLDSLAASQQARTDSIRAESERLAAAARSVRPEIIERIVHAPDTTAIREAVTELEAAHEVEVSALRAEIFALDSAVVAANERALAEYTARTRLEAALQAAQDVSAVSSDTRRGFVERWGERLFWTAVGAGIGYVAGGA